MAKHRRRQIVAACNDIKAKSFASRRERPPTQPSAWAVGDVCGRRRTAGTSKNRTASCQTWEIVTRQMTVVEIIIVDLRWLSNGGRRVRLCVLVNAVYASDQCTCETTRAVSAAQELRNIDGRCRTAAPHTSNQGLIANLSNRVCPAQHGLWRDVTDVRPASYVRDHRGCTKWDRQSETHHRDGLT